MRTSPFAIANLAVIVAIAGFTLMAVGSGRHSDFTAQTQKLEQQWSEMSSEGVAPSALAPLKNTLLTSSYQAPWWSPAWWNDPGTAFVQRLEAGTDGVWNQAMTAARTHATAALLGWDLMVERNAPMLTSATIALSTSWSTRLAAATTPATVEALSADLATQTANDQTEALADEGTNIAALPSRLHQVLLDADQAGAENIAGSAAFLTAYQHLATAVAAKPDTAAMAILSAQVTSLASTVTATLQKDACGHNVPPGKAIVINLTLQEALFYQNGCVLEATPVTSGRRDERTPTGTFHVFRKDSPVLFTSWAPRSSPYWYPPERANYALEFTVVRAGIFLHDAPWEPTSAFGPGSQNTVNASHGCVHAPTSVMSWAYSWANIGTPVIVVD